MAATQSQRFLPASFQPVSSTPLTSASATACLRLLVRPLQRRADFAFGVGDGAERDRHAGGRLENLLDGTLADSLHADQVAHEAEQPRTDRAGTNVGRDRLRGDGAAAPAGPRVPLVLRDRGEVPRQLGDLVNRRRRIAGLAFGRQRRGAPRAVRRHVRHDPRQTLRRQPRLEVGRMARLPAGFLPRGRLRRPRQQRLWRLRRRRLELVQEVAELGLQREHLGLEFENPSLQGPTPRTLRRFHALAITTRTPRRKTGSLLVNGYAFSSLGNSQKLKLQTTRGGRMLHGKHGKGRFRAFGVGRSITWQSRYNDNGSIKEFSIRGLRSSLKKYFFEIGDEKQVRKTPTGVEVTIADIDSNFPSLTRSEAASTELSRRLALYLKQYPGIVISYDDHRVDPEALQESTQAFPMTLKDKDGKDVPGELTVIEWKIPTDRALYLCDEMGFALDEKKPGIQTPGFSFTAYLKSRLISELDEENALVPTTCIQ